MLSTIMSIAGTASNGSDKLHWKLSHNIRFRSNIFGRQILQVEVLEQLHVGDDMSVWKKTWRDATSSDVAELGLNKLVDV